MANIIIGKIAPVFKGEWSTNVTYTRLDIVKYRGSSYVCIADTTIHTMPDDTRNWLLVAEKGDEGHTFTYDDFTPEQIAELQRPATDIAQDVSEAEDRRMDAEWERADAEKRRVAAEQQREAAEQQRANTFAGFEATIDRASLRLFDLQWEQAGGSVIVSGETYGLNDINDLSLSEAMKILSYKPLCDSPSLPTAKFSGLRVRTLFPICSYGEDPKLVKTFYSMWDLEVLQFAGDPWNRVTRVYEGGWAFYDCYKLREIKGVIDLWDLNGQNKCKTLFEKAPALEEVRVKTTQSLTFKDSSRLSLASMQYLVANANNTKVIIITVHPDIFAKFNGDMTNEAAAATPADELALWQELLGIAGSKNISFASA